MASAGRLTDSVLGIAVFPPLCFPRLLIVHLAVAAVLVQAGNPLVVGERDADRDNDQGRDSVDKPERAGMEIHEL